jgi:ABC-type transport system involved in Fe-S cluster assembly fused permease/ATPase subunit
MHAAKINLIPERGLVVEEGRHDDLVVRGGVYVGLVSSPGDFG